MDLERLLRPKSIAVIGGGLWCANVIDQCRDIGFSGAIWPVHPTRTEVGGLPAFADIASLPEAPDAAFVGVNRDQTIETVRSLAERQAGGAVCFASGFREAQAETGDGESKQAALLEAAGDMPILGPNCYGFLNYLDGVALWPDVHGGMRCGQGVAIVTQSSNIALNLTMQTRGLPVGYVVTVGNQAQTGLSAVARALLRDDRVTALGLHIEGIDDLSAFQALAAEAWGLGKPIVVLKVGRSEMAKAATISHTASLAGGDAGACALLRRLGIGQVFSLQTLIETLKLLHVNGPLTSNRIASMSCSGGEASLMADTAQGTILTFPPPAAAQLDALRTVLGERVALANPLDYHTYVWNDPDAMTACFTAMMQGDMAMGCIVVDFPRSDRCAAPAWETVIVAALRTKKDTGRPMALLASLPENMPETVAARLIGQGIVPLAGMEDAIAAMSAAADIGLAAPDFTPLLIPPPMTCGQVLSEADAKAELSAAGLTVPQGLAAASLDAAAEAAARIGYPVVLKGEGFAHKTEAGAVVLGLQDADGVRRAASSMAADRFLVEEMVVDTVAELLVGVIADTAHGYVLTLAAGGILAELLDDRVSLLLPASRNVVRRALGDLRIARILDGYRGRPAANIEAILDAVMAVQSYVARSLPLEIEINPLMCGRRRAVAADALIRTGDRR